MSDLVRSLVVAGLLSGTQPITLMGVVLSMGGAAPRRTGAAFVFGAFIVETGIVLTASFLVDGSVEPSSGPARAMLIVKIAAGIALVVIGVRLRRPPKKPAPATPKSLERLNQLTPIKAFVAGILLADYVGPVLASSAIATAPVGRGGQLLALALFTLLATGIPAFLVLYGTHSDRAQDRLENSTSWVMEHRRPLASWIVIVVGVLLTLSSLLTLLTL